jgi:alpha-amylase/alpha-mannosidase (GH57 family)
VSGERSICLHGHFYQPPRENPWLEAIERQPDAAPYHDWNARINDECYTPNAVSRVLDSAGLLERVANNYERISFNFGPTLLSWLEQEDPRTLQRIIDADRHSVDRWGHGNAIAQCYNHMIMPLANDRDRRTQVRWGIADFEHRFGRKPEGMWLPETAVDTASLEVLAEFGIRFTLFAPRQAAAVRRIGTDDWQDVDETSLDPSRAYRIALPSGRSIDAFFYDGPIAQAVAFERLLNEGRDYAGRLMSAFVSARDHAELVHVATDGETYGHHHRHGEMALSAALDAIDESDVELTNYPRFLAEHPPEFEARLHENSSWSCAHGVERWRSDCGCQAHRNPGDHQRWREPLRAALDRLRDRLAGVFDAAAGELLKDPWAARDGYIRVILDRSDASVAQFFESHATRPLTSDEQSRALALLELQRHAMLMYTSCGWFFDDIAGIETVQVISYAARAAQLATTLTGDRFERAFLSDLEHAPGNRRDYPSGRAVYEELVRPMILELSDIAAHYAVNLVFRDEPDRHDVYCFHAERLEHRRLRAGRSSLVHGRVRLTSRITRDTQTLVYAVVHTGDHIVHGGAHPETSPDDWRRLSARIETAFEHGDLAEIVEIIGSEFDGAGHSLRSLLRDAQHQIADIVTETATAQAERLYSDLHEQHQPLVRFLAGIGVEVPPALALPARFVLDRQLQQAMQRGAPDIARVAELVDQARHEGIDINERAFAYQLEQLLSRVVLRVSDDPTDDERLEALRGAVALANASHAGLDLVDAQLHLFRLLHEIDFARLDESAIAIFEQAAHDLRVRMPAAHAQHS